MNTWFVYLTLTLYVIAMSKESRKAQSSGIDDKGKLLTPPASQAGDSASAAPTDLSVDEIVNLISKTFISVPAAPISSPSTKPLSVAEKLKMANNTGAIPNTYPESSTSSLFFSNQSSQPTIPKLPTFSGDEPTPKGEVPLMVWRYEVQYLFPMPDLSPLHVLHSMSFSLRGSARLMIVHLGDKASMPCIQILFHKRNSS